MNARASHPPTGTLKIREEKHRSYGFGSLHPLSTGTLDTLIDIFQEESKEKPDFLEGRVAPRFASIPEAGPVVIKFYKRGGWMARVNKELYLRISKIRSRKEFEFLVRAGKAGVSVPTPVAFVSRGGLFYRAWLITKEIADPVSFAQLCLDERKNVLDLIPEISRNIRLLIENGIHHVDLHPGNILIDKKRKIYIIDFDRARCCSAAGSDLAEKYQRRWARAIRKYSLPDVYSDLRLT
jgi:3-deoxy-D-manno-octulosonic acid kinase